MRKSLTKVYKELMQEAIISNSEFILELGKLIIKNKSDIRFNNTLSLVLNKLLFSIEIDNIEKKFDPATKRQTIINKGKISYSLLIEENNNIILNPSLSGKKNKNLRNKIIEEIYNKIKNTTKIDIKSNSKYFKSLLDYFQKGGDNALDSCFHSCNTFENLIYPYLQERKKDVIERGKFKFEDIIKYVNAFHDNIEKKELKDRSEYLIHEDKEKGFYAYYPTTYGAFKEVSRSFFKELKLKPFDWCTYNSFSTWKSYNSVYNLIILVSKNSKVDDFKLVSLKVFNGEDDKYSDYEGKIAYYEDSDITGQSPTCDYYNNEVSEEDLINEFGSRFLDEVALKSFKKRKELDTSRSDSKDSVYIEDLKSALELNNKQIIDNLIVNNFNSFDETNVGHDYEHREKTLKIFLKNALMILDEKLLVEYFSRKLPTILADLSYPAIYEQDAIKSENTGLKIMNYLCEDLFLDVIEGPISNWYGEEDYGIEKEIKDKKGNIKTYYDYGNWEDNNLNFLVNPKDKEKINLIKSYKEKADLILKNIKKLAFKESDPRFAITALVMNLNGNYTDIDYFKRINSIRLNEEETKILIEKVYNCENPLYLKLFKHISVDFLNKKNLLQNINKYETNFKNKNVDAYKNTLYYQIASKPFVKTFVRENICSQIEQFRNLSDYKKYLYNYDSNTSEHESIHDIKFIIKISKNINQAISFINSNSNIEAEIKNFLVKKIISYYANDIMKKYFKFVLDNKNYTRNSRKLLQNTSWYNDIVSLLNILKKSDQESSEILNAMEKILLSRGVGECAREINKVLSFFNLATGTIEKQDKILSAASNTNRFQMNTIANYKIEYDIKKINEYGIQNVYEDITKNDLKNFSRIKDILISKFFKVHIIDSIHEFSMEEITTETYPFNILNNITNINLKIELARTFIKYMLGESAGYNNEFWNALVFRPELFEDVTYLTEICDLVIKCFSNTNRIRHSDAIKNFMLIFLRKNNKNYVSRNIIKSLISMSMPNENSNIDFNVLEFINKIDSTKSLIEIFKEYNIDKKRIRTITTIANKIRNKFLNKEITSIFRAAFIFDYEEELLDSLQVRGSKNKRNVIFRESDINDNNIISLLNISLFFINFDRLYNSNQNENKTYFNKYKIIFSDTVMYNIGKNFMSMIKKYIESNNVCINKDDLIQFFYNILTVSFYNKDKDFEELEFLLENLIFNSETNQKYNLSEDEINKVKEFIEKFKTIIKGSYTMKGFILSSLRELANNNKTNSISSLYSYYSEIIRESYLKDYIKLILD